MSLLALIFHYSLQALLYLQLFVLVQAVGLAGQCPFFPLSLPYFDANLVIVAEYVPYDLVSGN